LYCNGVETCVNRSCEAGATVDCRDGISCTADACNENARACDHTPNDSRCDDGQFCDGDEVCDPMLGCQGGPGPCVGQQCDEARRTCTGCVTDTGCDDGNPCTTDTCVTGGGCRNVDTCGSTPIVFEEANTGTSTGSSTVVTTANVIGVPGDLYLAAISYKPNTTVTAMTGLGLTWTRLRAQCAGRGQTGIELWVAQGIPSGHDVVTAALAAVVEGAVIAVSRYSGVNASDPIGSFGSANSNGVGGACWGGIDGPSYSYDLPSASAGSVVYGASATRHRTHAPGSGYHERTELVSGVDGSAAGLAASDRIAGSTAGVTVDGTLSGDEDWAVLAAEIRPATTTADCQVDFDCDDGILDNGAETCVAGACRAGPPVGSGGNVATGASDLSSTVVTAANVLGVPGDLYLAAISYKPNTVVTAVSGLGLTWTRLGGQCAGRGQTGVEVWSAQGMPSGDGVVTAALAVAVESAVIAVSRYTGISTDDPIGSVESANSNGADGPCTEGSDSVSYIYELPQVGAGSIVYSTAAMRHRAHMPGVAYQYRGGIINGYDGTAASVAASDRAVASASTVIVDGSFSSPVDWAAMAVELKPSVTAACSGGAPCDDGL
jgi:hypothetical protein